MQGHQLYTSIQALMDWDNPSPDEKRQAVIQVLNSVFIPVDTIKSAMVELKEAGVNLLKIRKACGKWIRNMGGKMPKAQTNGPQGEQVNAINDEGLARVNAEAPEDSTVELQMGRIVTEADAEERLSTRLF